jgi:hypothetical protein
MFRFRYTTRLSILAFLSVGTAVFANPIRWGPTLERYCFDCHDSDSAKGGIDLEAALGHPLADQSELWEKSARQLQMRLMPPIKKERPSETDYVSLASEMEAALDAQAATHPNPGRTESLRRLNRNEYQNAVRDLLAVEIDAKSLLPPDQLSHGFDNVTVGDLPPALLNRYISAAQKISRIALGHTNNSPDGRTVRIRPDITQEGHVEGLPLGTRGGTLFGHTFPKDGDYELQINLTRDRDEKVEGLRGTHELQVLVDGDIAKSFSVKPPKRKGDHTKVDAHLSARIRVGAGVRQVGVTFVEPAPDLIETLRQPYESAFNQHRHPRRSPAIYQVSITGPFDAKDTGMIASRQQLIGNISGKDEADAQTILHRVMHKAYRGHANKTDEERVLALYREAGNFENGLESALSAILASPKFFFRVERDPEDNTANSPYALEALELASRLSFFLWSSLPDDELLDAAESGQLTTPEGMTTQARRMLADSRSQALVDNFAGQWLYLRNLDSITPDSRLYPDFDDNLRQAMRKETELLFQNMLREDRSVLDLLQSDHTYLNERLAKHYGIPHIYGERFRKVALDSNSNRGGLLRHGSILTVTSYATRTSPVLRGHWVMKNLLGTPPPPPPPDVPALEDNAIDEDLPVRERLAEHRANPACASCHNSMDPIGFAFENFDAVGRWRTQESGQPVDSKGTLPDGSTFDGIAGLEAGLLKRPELFARTFVEKLFTYALGRGIEPGDSPTVRQIVRGAAKDNYQFSSIILHMLDSDPFTMRMPESSKTLN